MGFTLGKLLQKLIGQRIILELKDESAIEGKLCAVNPSSIDIELAEATLYVRRVKKAKPLKLNSFFAKGRYIRFVHFENYSTITRMMKWAFSLIIFCLILTSHCKYNAIRKNRCELKIVADYDFYSIIGNHNYAMAARYLINLVERLNQLFSSVDWGWDINGDRLTNIGFLINAIKIHNHTTSNKPDHFNSNTSKEEGVFSYEEVLRTFSIEEGTKDSCLTLLISAKIFSANVLGISNIGHNGEKGICAIKGLDKQFTNTAIATVKRRSGLMITREVDLVVAHEIGHSLGSYHDEDEATNDPDGSEDCLPKNSQGRYVMHGSPNSGYEKNNYNFSPCSIRSIQRTLYELASKCFVEEKIAFCGNGILEKGEECDVGSEINAASDRCCTSECTLRQVSHCSPYNFECCTDDCQVASVDQICQARNSDICRNASFCNGVSKTCPEPTILKDGSECDDEGKCINGECKSACHLHSPELSPCLCERENETCHRCCRSKTDGKCKPIGLGKLLPEDSICIHGQCHNNICEKKLTDSTAFFLRIIGDIGSPNSPRIFNDYFIFIIVTITLLIWLPCGAIIVYKDGNNEGAIREERENIEYIHVNKGPTTLPEANAE